MGPTGPTGADGLMGPTGPTGPSVIDQGFSAFKPTLILSSSSQIGTWTVDAPYYDNVSFNTNSGTFTVPATGRYSIKATINYSTTAALTATLGASVNPAFVIRRITPVSTVLISGLAPILNVNILGLLSLRAILGNGIVTLVGDVELNAGDSVGLFYEADGLPISLNLGGVDNQGITWSVFRLT